MAAQETQLQQRTQQKQQQQVAGQLGAAEVNQQKQFQQEKRALTQQEIGIKEESYRKVAQLFDGIEQDKTRLGQAKYKAQMEQAGFILRLNTEKYTDKLKIEGRKARLNDGVQFRESLQKAIFSEERDLLNSSMKFRSMMNADERKFREESQMIDVNLALELADVSVKSANERAKMEAIGSIGSTVVSTGDKVYTNYESNKAKADVPLDKSGPTSNNPYGKATY
jgi:hypothetical protein